MYVLITDRVVINKEIFICDNKYNFHVTSITYRSPGATAAEDSAKADRTTYRS